MREKEVKMIKNKYYIGQRVRVITSGLVFTIERIKSGAGYLMYSESQYADFYDEQELEPLPEKQKIVLWQWLHKSDGKWYQHIASEDAYIENQNAKKVKIVEEVEL
jgi:hypothetical protein